MFVIFGVETERQWQKLYKCLLDVCQKCIWTWRFWCAVWRFSKWDKHNLGENELCWRFRNVFLIWIYDCLCVCMFICKTTLNKHTHSHTCIYSDKHMKKFIHFICTPRLNMLKVYVCVCICSFSKCVNFDLIDIYLQQAAAPPFSGQHSGCPWIYIESYSIDLMCLDNIWSVADA